MSRFLALSGHAETICSLSAFGPKRTCRNRARRIDRARMTRSCHPLVDFAALHNGIPTAM
jgi:hypothetical protein